MKFELHCHSRYSRGKNIPTEATASPGEIVRALRAKGFAGVAITDHDSIKSWKEASTEARRLGMVFIHACEISTLDGHVIGLGLTENVRRDTSAEEAIEEIRSQGGIAVAPHPFDLRNEGVGMKFSLCDAAEAFNSLNLTRLENGKAQRKIREAGIPAVGGSDAHALEMLGLTVNHIEASSAEEALSAIRKGKVRIEGSYVPVPAVVRWARQRMRSSYPEVIRYVDANYGMPRAVFSKFMLRRFVGSDSSLWNSLGYVSIGMATAYSALRAAAGR
jgi:predicted metal-dependent phosphoesterase TrpH